MSGWEELSTSRVDSHVHFWRYDAPQYQWIPESSLRRDVLPTHFFAAATPLGISACVAVQARQSVAETDWLLGIADVDARVLGVVGWVKLLDCGAECGDTPASRDLARLARHPKLLGLRHVAQDEEDDEFLARPAFVAGVARLAPLHLAYDLLVFPRQLPAAVRLVAASHHEQVFVLDHIAKPPIAAGAATLEPWRSALRALAAHPNVWCKVSGVITEADHAAWTPAHLEPFLDAVVDAFTPARLLFGSDSPVCELARGGLAAWVRALEAYMEKRAWSEETRAGFWEGNARKAYGF